MQASGLRILLVVCLSAAASSASSHRVVKVRVLATLAQHVSGVGVGIGAGTGPPIPPDGDIARSIRCPADSPETGSSTYGCLSSTITGQELGTAQNWRVQVIITGDNEETYYAILGCQRQYGWCTSLQAGATYVGELNDQSKWLENYQHRPVHSFIKVAFRPNGKKKVTYQIEYAAKVILVKP